jgi:3-isopropylmalate/(R)-2-methylmalate dehydratase small subunit
LNPFTSVTGTAVPLRASDINTDIIIPQKWLITTERHGLGAGFFGNLRYLQDGSEPDPSFILNEPRFRGAQIVVAGSNYGCGSSREHAVWAHLDYGIRAVIASSFGPIFFDNALKNGLAVVTLGESHVAHLIQQLQMRAGNTMTVSLVSELVIGPDEISYPFTMDPDSRSSLLSGLDDIQRTIESMPAIDAFETADRVLRPWIWDDSHA